MTGAKCVRMADKKQFIIDVDEGDKPIPIIPKSRSKKKVCCDVVTYLICLAGVMSFWIWLRPSMFFGNVPATKVLDNLCEESQKASVVTNRTRGFTFDNGFGSRTFSDGDIEKLKLAQAYNHLDTNPLRYTNPARQIMIKLTAESRGWSWRAEGLQLWSRQCVEYGTWKYYTAVVQCTRADSAFQDAMQNLTRIEAGVTSFECNYTLQLAPDEASAIWTNESCKTVLGNGLVYHDITQVTYKAEIKTMDNHNFGNVRKDMATWCECVNRLGFGNYYAYYGYTCLEDLSNSTASRAIIQGKGYQQACSKPGEVMIGVIPWKKYP